MTTPPPAAETPPAACAEQIGERASRFQAVADMAPMMVWMAGTDRVFDWFNQPWLRFTGRSMADEIGQGWIASVHPEDVERCLGIYDVSFDALAPFEMDFRLRRHDGAYRWVLDQGAPHHSPDGRFLGYVGCCIDIDDRRSVEDRLALRAEALRLSERRRDLFLTTLVDELSASLSSARQAALALAETSSASDAIATARALGEALQAQLARLLGEARRSARSVTTASADRQTSTLAALLRQAIDAVPLPLLRSDSRLRLTAPGTDRLLATAPPLARIVGGLLETALRCSEQASTLDVLVMLDERNGALSIRLEVSAPGRLSPAFLSLALAYFPDPVGAGREQAPLLQSAREAAGPVRNDATVFASGVAVFPEAAARAVTFVIGSPWVEPHGG